ncbi:MAG TPA: ComF family protein [Paraburkholderia sp.]|nr:ComF family protein [Paraburkholderia sp.]
MLAASYIRSVWHHTAGFVLPNLCVLCGNLSHERLCEACDPAYWNEARLRCVVCAIPLSGFARAKSARYRCGDCVSAPPAFDATIALADYRAPLDALALGLKFRARLMLAREFGERLARAVADSLAPSQWPDVVAPVPLARKRLVERGYNQAWEIARPLAAALRVRADPVLIRRIIDTVPQSRLDLDARRANVSRAFAAGKPVRGRHVAIVDDVMTSGATLEALARTLKAAGAARVTNFVALRTPKN